MKKIMKRLFTVVIIALGMSCEEPVSVPETERVTNLLKGSSWKISSVQVDGTSSSLFTGMTLSFSNTTYSSTNASPVWPASGGWSFKDDAATTIRRSDGVEVVIENISETALALNLTWAKQTLGSGRSKSISGKHRFSLTK